MSIMPSDRDNRDMVYGEGLLVVDGKMARGHGFTWVLGVAWRGRSREGQRLKMQRYRARLKAREAGLTAGGKVESRKKSAQ
jgi:hypothetical protein